MAEAREDIARARVIVVDDHAFMRMGTRTILSSDDALEVVGEAENGEGAIARCRELRPDLVLMDVSMPGMGGIEATRSIKAEFPEMSVLMLTAHADPDILIEAVEAGAAGYVLKDARPHRLVDAVRAVLEGESSVDQGLVMGLLKRLGEGPGSRPPEVPSSGPPLSERELAVVRLIASGKTNRDIARALLISLSSVKMYVQRVVKKLGVSDRTQAAVKAAELGLLSAERM